MAFVGKIPLKNDRYYHISLVLFFLLLPASSLAAIGMVGTADTLEAHTHYREAQKMQDQADYSKATNHFLLAAERFLKEGYYTRAAHCYNEISYNHRVLSRFEEARESALKAQNIVQEHNLPVNESLVFAHYNLAKVEAQQTNFGASDSLFQIALKLANSNPGISPGTKASVLSGLGSLYDDQGDYETALGYYQDAIALLGTGNNGHRRQLADLYNYIGVTYAKTGKYSLALDFYQKQQEINFELYGKNHPDIAGVFNNIGALYYRQGDIGEAVNFFKKAANTLIRVFGRDHPGVALVYNNIGECYMELNRYREAISYLENAVEIKINIRGPDHPDVAVSYNNIGQVYTEMGEAEQAHNYITKALQIRKEKLGPNHPQLADTYHSLGTLSLDLNQPDQALEYFNTELDIINESLSISHPRVARAYGNIAKAYLQSSDYGLALRNIQQALVLISSDFDAPGPEYNPGALQFRYPEEAMDLLISKARILHDYYLDTGNTSYLELALDVFQTCSDLMDRLQVEFQSEDSKLLMARRNHNVSEEAIRAAYDLFRETENRQYLHEIFYFAEKSKSRIIREQVKSDRAKQFAGIPDSLVKYEKSLRARLAEARQQLNSTLTESTGQKNNTRAGILRDSVFTLKQALNRYLENLRQQYPRYHRFLYSSSIPSVPDLLQELKGEGKTIVEYFYGSSSLWAIILDPRGIEVQKLPFDGQLPQKIKRLNRSIYTDDTPEYLSLSRHLYSTLVAPLQDRVTTRELHIVPDGALNLLPFETLLQQPVQVEPDSVEYSRLPYLVHTYSISYMPSVSISASREGDSSSLYSATFETEFAAFAPVFSFSGSVSSNTNRRQPGKKWGPLPASEYEVNQIAGLIDSNEGFIDRLFGNDHPSRIYIGEQATERSFKQFSNGDYRYLHLATHAFVADSTGNASRSGISFYPDSTGGEDGVLHDYEIYNLSLNSELVVLSACETGTGTVARGEGIIGLSRAFQYAGARNLLVSLWSIDDRSTARLMIRFYDFMLDEPRKAFALQQSKIRMIEGMEFAHPRYWAPFVLIGNQAANHPPF